jgi:L-asparaginase II
MWPRALAQAGRTATALHNNCSGKHAGFVCLGCLMAHAAGQDARAFVHGYVRPDHPVMREVSAALQAATGTDLGHMPVGTDGCSIPTLAQPLRALAWGFARVATGQGLSADHARAARRLRQAIARAPFMVAGTGRFDTRVMQHFGERVCCKVGAEGVYCAALPGRGLGVAIKMDDGQSSRAAEVVMATLIRALVASSDADQQMLQPLCEVELTNWNGQAVGRLQAADALRQLVKY